MYERSLNEAELILSVQKNSILPVHIVWEEVVKRAKKSGFEVASLPDFSAMLEGDKRFQIIPAQKNQDEEEFLDEVLEDTEMEKLGFYPEDRVRLRVPGVLDNIDSEDEEEVGSIKRKAFLTTVPKIKEVKSKIEQKPLKKSANKKKLIKATKKNITRAQKKTKKNKKKK